MRHYSEELLKNFTLIELESFDNEQLSFPIEMLKSLLRMREDEKREDERIENFWKNEYPNLSREEQAKHWAGGLFRSMREQEESNLSPYAIYSERWLKEVLEQDRNFMELLPFIYNIWGGMFDAGKVDRIISNLLKKIQKQS